MCNNFLEMCFIRFDMGNLPSNLNFKSEFGINQEKAASQGILAQPYYGDAQLVTDRWLYGEFVSDLD